MRDTVMRMRRRGGNTVCKGSECGSSGARYGVRRFTGCEVRVRSAAGVPRGAPPALKERGHKNGDLPFGGG